MRRYADADLSKIDTAASRLALLWLEEGTWKKGANLILAGPVGTGKTFLAWAVMNWFRENVGPTAAASITAASVPELLERMRPPADFAAADPYLSARFLLLDDLGAEIASDWARGRLYVILNSRYNNLYPTIVTTNANSEQLADHLGDRIVSRLIDNATLIQVDGPDRRKPAKGRKS